MKKRQCVRCHRILGEIYFKRIVHDKPISGRRCRECLTALARERRQRIKQKEENKLFTEDFYDAAIHKKYLWTPTHIPTKEELGLCDE